MFTLHGLLTMEWWGEWEYFEGSTRFWIFVTDISSAIGLISRFVGSLIAAISIVYYFIKKGLSTPTTLKLLKIVLIMEAIYWFTFITSGIWGITPVVDELLGNSMGQFIPSFVFSTGIPCLFEAIALPIALFKVVRNLSSTKPQTGAIKWSLIAGTCYIFVWWLNNAGVWSYGNNITGNRISNRLSPKHVQFSVYSVWFASIRNIHRLFRKEILRNQKNRNIKTKNGWRHNRDCGILFSLELFELDFLWNPRNLERRLVCMVSWAQLGPLGVIASVTGIAFAL